MKRQFVVQQFLNITGMNKLQFSKYVHIDRAVIYKYLMGHSVSNGAIYQLKYYYDEYCIANDLDNKLFDVVISEIEKGGNNE
ncbi:MAG: hypothetical protein WBA74_10295 [Cyclobacteriaceae bacterium]